MLNLNLKQLPEWEAYSFLEAEEGEEWKDNQLLEAGKILYNQWREVFQMVMALIDTLPGNEEDQCLSTRQMILENIHMIAPKILSASAPTMYMMKMENAALIRLNCREMMQQVDFAVISGEVDISYRSVIDDRLELFKLYFRDWVSLFKKDEFEDDWNLFN